MDDKLAAALHGLALAQHGIASANATAIDALMVALCRAIPPLADDLREAITHFAPNSKAGLSRDAAAGDAFDSRIKSLLDLLDMVSPPGQS